MTEAPKLIWAWPHFDGWITGDWSANTYYDERTVAYILAAEHDRIVAEKDAEIARLRKSLKVSLDYHSPMMPGDSRAVPDWFVACAAVECELDDADGKIEKCLDDALAALGDTDE